MNNMNNKNQSNSAMTNNAQQGMNSSAQIDANIEAYKKAQQNSNQNSMQ
ncbi:MULTISPECIES: hypothetical protein [unclassified Clostridium]|nr:MULTISPECIES: hypothetical protein [unclassified Clostridium]MBP3916332.1 hypothetical protein [Clostridium sp.]